MDGNLIVPQLLRRFCSTTTSMPKNLSPAIQAQSSTTTPTHGLPASTGVLALHPRPSRPLSRTGRIQSTPADPSVRSLWRFHETNDRGVDYDNLAISLENEIEIDVNWSEGSHLVQVKQTIH
jgi:hypothetical protein